jgi:hypothetical protein
MAFPISPTNGQTATVNGITYTYSDTYGTWTRLRTDANVITSLANAAFDRANAAYNAANTATDPWVRTQANNAYDKANSGATFANGAFVTANAAFTSQNTTADFANGAFVAANSGATFANAAFLTANSAASFANGAFTTANLKFNSSGGTISGDVSITGNLSITGNTFSTSATQIVANDTLFIMGTGNYSGDVLDIGFAGHYNNGTNAHTGLIRDAGTKEWQLFEEYTPEIGGNNNIVITDTSFKIATLNANLKSTTITVKGIDLLPYVNSSFGAANSSAVYANGAFAQANSNYTSAVTKLAVTTPGMYYSVDQYSGNNPTIYIRAGETIAFDLDVSGHPFMIRVSSGGANYDTGLIHVDTDGTLSTGSSAQGKITGTLYWKVPYDIVGSTYVYQCSAHSGMVGNIVIDQPTAIAFTQANTANDNALSAGNYANGAFAAANTADSKATSASLYANAAFAAANSGSSSTFAFNQANAAFLQSNSAFGAANSTALYANGAFLQSNSAFDAANSASLYANAAFAAANSGSSSSFAFNQANAAFAQANAAFAAANTGGGGGSNTTITIQTNKFVANGSTSTFNLSVSPLSEDFVTAVVDGIVQLRDTYTITGNVIYFDTTFENGANVEVTTLSGNSYVGGASSDTYARDTANAAFIQANAAFTQANTGGTSLSKAIAMSIVFGF